MHDHLDHVALPLPLTRVRAAAADARNVAVVVFPSAFGVGPDLEAQLGELAVHARLVVALDPFHRGDAGLAAYDEMPRVMARLRALPEEHALADLRAAAGFARATCARVVVVGICFGGPFAIHAAADGLVDAAVTWHGTGMERPAVLARAAAIRCPLRMHFGDADPFVPPAAVDAVRAAFAHHADARVVVHAGATHGFSHRGAPQAYDAEAERAAMRDVVEVVRAL